jgi:hypothetical protein
MATPPGRAIRSIPAAKLYIYSYIVEVRNLNIDVMILIIKAFVNTDLNFPVFTDLVFRFFRESTTLFIA